MLRNCMRCNKVFSHPTQRICMDCHREKQGEFTKVKEFLQENPKARVAEVSDATEVSVDTIYEFIRDGKLNVTPADAQLSCDVCDTPIKNGRICPSCRDQLQHGTGGKSSPAPANEMRKDGRVHLLDKIRDRDRD